MKRKIISTLFALVLVLTMSLVTAAPVAAATITVPGDYGTIQAAIDAAGTDDTIIVSTGTYTEDLVILAAKTNLELKPATGESVTIKGVSLSQWGVTTIPNIEILADGVSIHGFTIQGPEPSGTLFAAGMILGAQDVEIYNNAFEVNNASDEANLDDVCQGIVAYNQLAKPGVDISGLSIHDNTFTHRGTGTIGYEGIYVNRDAGTGSISIVDNVFTGDIIRGITVERSNATISGNSLVATAGWAWTGVLVMNVGSAEAQDSVSVTGNTITGFDNGIKVGGTGKVLTNISVTQNTIEGNDTGVLVRSSAGGVVVNNNSIIGNTTYGVENTDSVSLDATSNWWGTVIEAEITAMVSGPVNYSSWLTAAPTWVEMSASSPGVIIGISVSPTSVDFGNLIPGTPSASQPVTVTNTGNVPEDFSASIENESPVGVYTSTPGLEMDGASVAAWLPTGVAVDGTEVPSLVLTVPTGIAAGTYTATLVFWAETTP